MNSKKNEVIVSIKKEEKEKLDKLIFTVAFFLLIRDLEQEGMLTCIGDEDQVDGILGEYYMEGQNIRLPTEVKGYAFKYFQSLIFLSEDLKELVDDNFRDKEEIRYRETLFVAVAALITSILLGVWGIWN